MRVLLRDIRTGLYFCEPGDWTAERDRALSFKHSAEAMSFAREKRLQQAEIVLAFEESAYLVSLSLP
jgi:hypothetical protein